MTAGGLSQDEPSPPTGAAEIYTAACAACHGADGRGAPSTTVGFETPLPDFTDCRFTTREPDADWVAVTHGGGPARGFSTVMPAFGEALTLDQIQLALQHVRSVCTSRAWPRGELNLPRPLVTEKAYPEDELVFTTSAATDTQGMVTNELVYEQRVGARSQIEVSVPVIAREAAPAGWSGGIGDVALGVKRTLFHRLSSGSILSVTGEVVLPTGDADRGFGKGTAVIEPFVTFGQLLPADGFLHLQTGVELPTDTGRASREAFWRGAVGKSFTQGRFGRVWSPMVELLASRELETGEATAWDVLPQVQVTLNTRQHIMAAVGLRIPVTDAGSRDTQVLVYLLWDWFDGGFLEGW